MKIIFLIFSLVGLYSIVDAQKDTVIQKGRDVWYEPAPKGMSFLASGTYTRIVYEKGDTIIFKKTVAPFWMSNEITNKEFREFTNALAQNPSDSLCWNNHQKAISENADITQIKNNKYRICKTYSEASKNIIDTTLFQKEDVRYKHYFSNKVFDDYPVVGVSYTGAKLYCIWKTKTEIEKIKLTAREPFICDYRLPCEEEWYYAASIPPLKAKISKGLLQKVKSGERSKNSLYHFSNNVSEWTSTPFDRTINNSNVVLGGSWKEDSDYNKKFIFDKDSSSNYIGFRIVRSYISQYRK